MAEPDGGDSEDIRARLDRLASALDEKRVASEARGLGSGRSGDGASTSAMAMGMRAASDFVAGILVGGFIGWELDSWLGTRPWLLMLFFLLGSAAGIWNVIRVFSGTSTTTKVVRDEITGGPGA